MNSRKQTLKMSINIIGLPLYFPCLDFSTNEDNRLHNNLPRPLLHNRVWIYKIT